VSREPIRDLDKLRAENPSARLFDTFEDGQANTGHDQASWVDRDGKVGPKDKAYRLSWDAPRNPEVEALLEYLKTL